MKTYIGSKIIQAEPMDKDSFLHEKNGCAPANEENMHGYKVVYPDGYTSWSPKDVFENAYREVTEAEMKLI